MPAGYLAHPFKEIQNNDYDALLYCKTNIAGFFFDGFLNVSHERKLTTTSSPVETGAAIVDHAYVEPAKITMKIIVSDVHSFSGHIVCDPESKSEIVVPIITRDGKRLGVLDIDSPELNRFTLEDQVSLEHFVQTLLEYVYK